MRYLVIVLTIFSFNCFAAKVDQDVPAKKVVLKMLEEFKKMGDNKTQYIKGKYDYNEYMRIDKVLSAETSVFIDFYDVCEKSLKYDYDEKTKGFKKDHWAGKTAADKNYFTDIFKQLIESIVYPIANDYFGSYRMTYQVLESGKTTATIRCVVQNKKKRRMNFNMDWFLHNTNGAWKIYDVDVDGEMWVPSFRSQFNDVISEKSYDKLIELMNKKLKETREDREADDKAAVKVKRGKKK